MSFFDTISRIIQQGKEMAVKATPSSKQTYTKVTPVNNSQFTSNPLLKTGAIKPAPVTFGVPTRPNVPAPVLPTTANSTRQTVTPAPIRPPQIPQPPINPLDIIRNGKEAVLRMPQGNEATAKVRPNTIFNEALFGNEQDRAYQNKLANEGTNVGMIARAKSGGILGTIASSFARTTKERQDATSQALIDKGIDPNRAIQIAYQVDASRSYSPMQTRAEVEKSQAAKEALDALSLTSQEKRVLSIRKLIDAGETALDTTSFGVGGLTKNVGKTLLKDAIKGKELDTVEKFIDFQRGINLTSDFDPVVLRQEATAIADKLGIKETGPKLADKFAEVLSEGQTKVPNRAGAMDVKKPNVLDKTVLKKTEPLEVEAKKYKSAEDMLYALEKKPLDVGIDRKNLAEAYRLGVSNNYIIFKKTGRTVQEPVIVEQPNGKTTTRYDKVPEMEGRIVTFDDNVDPNLYNAFLRAKERTFKVTPGNEELKSQLTDIWNQAHAKPAPVNKKLEAFKSGKPSSEGGYIRNPLVKAPEKSPKDNQVVSSGNDSIDSYVKDNIKKRQLARGEASISQKIKDTAKLTGVKLVDFTLPITNTLNKGLKKDPIARAFLEKNPSQNVNNQIDRVLRAPALAGKYVEDKGFDKIIQQVKDVDEFDEYLIAKHAIDVDTRGINTGRNVRRDEQLVKALAPQYEKQAQAVMQYNRDLLDKVTEAGLISKETNKMLKERYPNYVPLQRVFDIMEDAPTQGSGRGVGSLSKQTVVQKLVGSDREIESPIKSILERTNNAVFQIEKNEAARLIASYEKLKDNPFNLKQINEVKDAGRGMGTISFFKDGKKVIYEVNEDVAEAAKALNVEQMNILNKILALPVRIARAGITGLNPAFIAKNVARDQVGAFIMADRGLRALPVNPVNFLKSLWATLKHDELYDEWIRIGGGGSSYDLGREQVGPTLARIRAGRSKTSKALYTVTRPSELLRAVEDIVARSEEITRLQQYRAARDNAVKRGLSADEAKVVGAQQSRENSTNFARRGEWGTVMNSTILYLNAGIQGSRLLIRNLKNKPLATSTKIASTLFFPTATITYWNISDPERKKAYDDIQDYEKETNLIIVPPNPVQDEKGKWNVIKIPLPPGVGNFASLVRLPIEKMNDSNPKISAEMAKSLVKSVSPVDITSGRGVVSSLTPQIIKPSIEAITNKSLFTGNPIVYQSEEKLSPEMQVRDYTSGTAQGIANTLGVSPIKTEAFLKSTGGGITDNILNASDRALVKTGLMSPDKIGGKSVLESIKGGFAGAKGGKTQDELTDKIYEIKKTSADNAEIRKQDAERILGELKTLPPEQANARLKEIKANDEALFKKIKATKLAEDLNWNKEEKAIEGLGVTDGTKANYVYQQVNKLQTADEKNTYLKDLLDRKIISKEVLNQIKELKKSDVNNDIIQ